MRKILGCQARRKVGGARFRRVELAARASLLPRRFGVDAIILFYDITTLPVAMGQRFVLQPSVGPVPDHPVRTLADVGDKRAVILFYGSKDLDSITFREELENLKARLDLTVVHVLADPPVSWTGERGFMTAEVLMRHLPRPYPDHEYFICGPAVMMDAIEKALGELGVPMSKYHSERYSFV